jgi:serine/threonine protein kinase
MVGVLPLVGAMARFISGRRKWRKRTGMAGREGQTLGNYRLTRLLGSGGFAEVYLGEHIHLGTLAAIKVLSMQLVNAEEAERFRQEARTIAALVHPNIVRVFDFNVEQGVPYLVMDYAPDGSLRQNLPQGTPLPLATILPLVKQVASALQYAHDQRLVHRDVKPENMLLGRQKEVLLSDFGTAVVAQATAQQSTQGIAGTAGYMAPEQLQGHARPASDQYSLGIVLYEWLTGERPFKGNYIEVASQHVLAPPPPVRQKVPGVSPMVEQVVLTALAKDPKDRFASVRAFAAALEQAAQGASFSTAASPLLSTQTPGVLPTTPVTPSPATQYPSGSWGGTSGPSPSGPWGGAGGTPSFQAPTPHPGYALPTIAGAYASQPPAGAPVSAPPAIPAAPAETRRGITRRELLIGGLAGVALVGVGGAVLVLARGGTNTGLSSSPTHTPAATATSGAAGTASPTSAPSETSTTSPAETPSPTATTSPTGRLVITYRGHAGEVDELIWMPGSGSRVATSSFDTTVQIWDAATGQRRVTYSGHTDQVWTLAWSPNGLYVASGGRDKTVQVWAASNGQVMSTYTGHSAEVEAVDWSPDSTLIASASYDNTVRVWEALTQQFVTTYSGHTDQVWAASWSPDGKLIASGSKDTTVHIWDSGTGTQVRVYTGHAAGVPTVKWSPNGKLIASSSYDRTVRVWNPQNGATAVIYKGHTDQVYGLSWSPDGSKIASASRDGTVQIWTASTGKTLYVYRNHQGAVDDVAWSPDGTRLASCGVDRTAQVWLAG